MKRTIIVLLILAGVSLNAIVGDNGVITNAMSAKQKQGMAILEEWLQEKYVDYYDNISQNENKVEELINIEEIAKCFYCPVDDGIGNLRYIVDSDYHVLYLIRKSGLPENIKKSLVCGEAGDKKYMDYATLTDVYGVTRDLKVYYCSNRSFNFGRS